jgi:hypothetical protein
MGGEGLLKARHTADFPAVDTGEGVAPALVSRLKAVAGTSWAAVLSKPWSNTAAPSSPSTTDAEIDWWLQAAPVDTAAIRAARDSEPPHAMELGASCS